MGQHSRDLQLSEKSGIPQEIIDFIRDKYGKEINKLDFIEFRPDHTKSRNGSGCRGAAGFNQT